MPVLRVLVACLLVSAVRVDAEPIARHRMANGVTLILQHRPGCGTFAIRLLARGGATADPDGMLGLTPVLARMLLQGTDTRSAAQQALEIEGAGASIGILSGSVSVGLEASGPAPAFSTALEVVADAALHPRLDPADLSRALTRERRSLDDTLESPGTLRRRALLPVLFERHPLGRIADPKRYLDAVDAPAVRGAYAERFVGSRMIVVMVGDFDPTSARERAIDLFGAVAPGTAVSRQLPSPAPLRAVSRRRVRVRTTQPQIVVAVPTRGIADDEEAAMDLLAHLLAGHEERIWAEVRGRRGWAYWVAADDMRYPGAGLFGIATAVKSRHLKETEAIIRDALARIASEAPSEEDTRRARRYAETSLARSWQRSAWRAAQFSWRETRDLAPLTFDEQRARFASVTPEAIRDLARDLLAWSPPAIVILR